MIRLALITKTDTYHFCVRQFFAPHSDLDPIPPELPMSENRLDAWLSTQGAPNTFRLRIRSLNIGDSVWVRMKYIDEPQKLSAAHA